MVLGLAFPVCQIHTKTDVNFWQQSFDTNVKYLLNEAYYDETMKERSYLNSEFQNNLKLPLSAKIKPYQRIICLRNREQGIY